MFPNEYYNSWVLLEYSRIAIFIRIDSGRSLNREIINKNVGYLQNLISQDKDYTFLKFCW
jgi:hypothetical protein